LNTTNSPSFHNLTVLGNLTVDTNTLIVDSSNNRVGIGTASPGTDILGTYDYPSTVTALEIDGNTFGRLIISGSDSGALDLVDTGGTTDNSWMQLTQESDKAFFRSITDAGLTQTDNILVLSNSDGRVGIGTASPGSLLTISGGDFNVTDGNNDFFVDVSANRVGIGTASPDGTLHVHTATAGTIDATSGADDFIVENSGNGGITILTPNANSGNIFFNSPSSSWAIGESGAMLRFNWDAAQMTIGTNVDNGKIVFNTGNFTHAMIINATGNVGIGTDSPVSILDLNASSPGDDSILYFHTDNTKGTKTDGFNIGVQDSNSKVFINQRETADLGIFVAGSERILIDSVGNVNFTGDIQIQGDNIFADGELKFGTDTDGHGWEFADGGLCVGAGGCFAPSTDGRAIFEGSVAMGVGNAVSANVYNSVGSGQVPDGADIDGINDLFIHGDAEIEGTLYLTSGNNSISQADIAENLLTRKGKELTTCEGNANCNPDPYEKELESGDVVCINIKEDGTIIKCQDPKSRFVVGVVSSTSVLMMGNSETYGYPIAVAGLVWTHVTNENGNIGSGDFLTSSSKPGYAMKEKNPEIGTVVGKAYGSCYEEECDIPMFVALN